VSALAAAPLTEPSAGLSSARRVSRERFSFQGLFFIGFLLKDLQSGPLSCRDRSRFGTAPEPAEAKHLAPRPRGETAEVRELAEEIAEIFRARDVHRETLAALAVFQTAVAVDAATADLARDLAAYLTCARLDPELRFERER